VRKHCGRRILHWVIPCFGAGVAIAQIGLQERQTFRSGVEVVTLDVTVLDHQRRPVRGLSATDFSVTVDGVAQPIVSVAEVQVPVGTDAPSWALRVAPEIISNQAEHRRLFLIIMDDALVPAHPSVVNETKALARRFIEQLASTDLAAVVFTRNNSEARDFTLDRTTLLKAIDRFSSGFMHPRLATKYSIDTLQRSVETLAIVPETRAAIIYLSVGPRVDPAQYVEPFTPGLDSLRDDTLASTFGFVRDLARVAHISNVPIYAVNPSGLVAPGPTGSGLLSADQVKLGNEFLRTVASVSGGRAIVDTNSPVDAVAGVLRETSTYYTVGYRPTHSFDPTPRDIRLTVSRDGVTVFPTRRRLKLARMQAGQQSARLLSPVLKDILPAGQLPLRLSLVPFREIDQKRKEHGHAVLILLEVGPTRDQLPMSSHNVDVRLLMFDGEGRRQVISQQHRVQPSVDQPWHSGSQVIAASANLPPGRYQVRIAAGLPGSLAGSVYSEVVIPDFDKSALSLSGIVLRASPAEHIQMISPAGELIPMTPSMHRTFQVGEQLSLFARIYQTRRSAPRDAEVTITVHDAADTVVRQQVEQIRAEMFKDSVAELDLKVPLEGLKRGHYLLSLEASSNGAKTKRALQFTLD